MLYATVPLCTKTENKVWLSGMLISVVQNSAPQKGKTRGKEDSSIELPSFRADSLVEKVPPSKDMPACHRVFRSCCLRELLRFRRRA